MSPIKGISDSVMLPRLGKIKLGIKRETRFETKQIEATDYFVCPDEVKRVLGDKPKELRIMFPTEDQEQWASQYLRRYSDSLELLCRGDGRRAITYAASEVQGARQSGVSSLRETACDRSTCEYYLRAECRKVMNLQFLLPDCPGFGVYQLDTGCIYSIRNVNAALLLTKALVSRVSMIPMSLKLVERKLHLQAGQSRSMSSHLPGTIHCQIFRSLPRCRQTDLCWCLHPTAKLLST